MIFCCTQKVIKSLEKHWLITSEKVSEDVSVWYVNMILLSRKKYFIITNSVFLYSVIIPAGTISARADFDRSFKDQFFINLSSKYNISPELFEEIFFQDERDPMITKTNNRSILGSMNDFKNMLEYVDQNYSDVFDQIKGAKMINSSPMSALKMKSGHKAIAEYLDKIVSSRK